MIMGKEKILPIFAMVVLLIGISSAIYVHANQINKDTITINGSEYSIDEVFSIAEPKTIETDEGVKTGVSLEDLLIKTGVSCTRCNDYTFKGKDGYQHVH